MPRFFTLQQANQALPEVERALKKLLALKCEYEAADGELKALSRRVMLSGGMQVRGETVVSLRTRKQQAAETLKPVFQGIEESGVLIKDLEAGLIDFPTMYRDREVYLCWRFGEPSIEFWHGVDEGFRGRKKIDEEFIAQHSAGHEQ